MSTVTKKLFTKEDPLHVHKTLGILVLSSFAWRLPKIVSYRSDMGFASHPEWTIPTLFLHVCLNLSSFEFHIPKQRIKEGGRIWPEYRLHALIFASRCLVCMAINWYEDYFQLEPNYSLNYIAVILTMLAADWASVSVSHPSNSIRGLATPPGVQRFFSLMQFFATSAALFGHERKYAVLFYNLFVVQVTPFVMTLRRKNLISHTFNVSFYGFLLVYGIWVGLASVRHDYGILRLVACMAALWRMGPFPFKNKYIIWTTMHLLLENFFRPVLNRHPVYAWMPRGLLIDASGLMTIAALMFIIYSHFSETRARSLKAAKKMKE